MPQHTESTSAYIALFLLLSVAILTGWLGYQGALLHGSSVRVGVNVVQPSAQILNVTSPNSNGTYIAGQTLQIHVQFDQTVYVNIAAGTPTLTLNSGGTGTYSTGNGSDTLVFTYTIQNGETTSDLDTVSTASLSTNGATIRNADSVAVTLTLPSPGTSGSLGSNKNIVIALASGSGSTGTTSNSNAQEVATETVSGGRRNPVRIAPTVHRAAPEAPECRTTIVQESYRDVPDRAWFASGVRTFLCKGYLDTSFDRFRSGAGTTRAEVAKLLSLVHTLTGATVLTPTFDDADPTQWYVTFLERVAQQKIMLGTDNCAGSHPCLFRPADMITRAEFVATLLRSFRIAPKGTSQEFSDVSQNAWYFGSISAAAEHCILQGDPVTGAMRPDDQVSRAEMVVMLDRLLQGALHCARSPSPITEELQEKETVSTDPSEQLPTSIPTLVSDVSTDTNDAPISCETCTRCGEGLLNFCNARECSSLGACVFRRTLLKASCAPNPSLCASGN